MPEPVYPRDDFAYPAPRLRFPVFFVFLPAVDGRAHQLPRGVQELLRRCYLRHPAGCPQVC